MRTIGILAGMGPRSTASFLELVLDQCQEQYGAKNDLDFPEILIYSLPTPFYLDRPLDHEAMQQAILNGLKRLACFGVSYLAMPCNTAHRYYDALAQELPVPLLHIVQETMAVLPDCERVTILATEATRGAGLYQDQLAARGYSYLFKEAWQEQINQLIGLVKSGEAPEKKDLLWEQLLAEVAAAGVEAVIIACTDLTPLLQGTTPDRGLFFVDSARALAAAVVREYLRK